MYSYSEAEMGAFYYVSKTAISLCNTLKEMGHPQYHLTPITTYNSTTHGLTLNTMVSKASNSNDMRFWWIKCWHSQKNLIFVGSWLHHPRRLPKQKPCPSTSRTCSLMICGKKTSQVKWTTNKGPTNNAHTCNRHTQWIYDIFWFFGFYC